MSRKKANKYARDDVERLLGYRVDELQTATRAYLSALISTYADGYRLSNLQIKVGTSRTYLRRAEKHSKHFYTMVIGLDNVLGHVEHGLQEYASIRDRVHMYDERGRSDDGKRSLYYVGLRCWNTVLLHELSHMLCHVHDCGEGHDDGFVAMYNRLLRECSGVDSSVLGTLNTHDLVRSASHVGDGIGPYRTRIFNKTKEWIDGA